MTSKTLFIKACSTAAVTLALAACGGGGSSGDAVQGGSTTGNAGRPSQDSFFAFVVAMVASSPDSAEPQEIDAVTATPAQNTEPSAVGG